jgi:plastocyanin
MKGTDMKMMMSTVLRLFQLVAALSLAMVVASCTCSRVPASTTKPTDKPTPTSPPATSTMPPGMTTFPAASPLGPTALGVTIALTARNQRFSVSSMVVPAGSTVTISFHNEDAGAIHNFSVYGKEDATAVVFRGDTTTGPVTVTYRFQAPSRGTYFFRCDQHPETMKGTLVAQ